MLVMADPGRFFREHNILLQIGPVGRLKQVPLQLGIEYDPPDGYPGLFCFIVQCDQVGSDGLEVNIQGLPDCTDYITFVYLGDHNM